MLVQIIVIILFPVTLQIGIILFGFMFFCSLIWILPLLFFFGILSSTLLLIVCFVDFSVAFADGGAVKTSDIREVP